MAKWLGGLRCHLVWRYASAQATLCSMGTQLLPQTKGRAPTQFLAHVYYGQTAGWINIPLGRPTEVNLGRGDVVLDGVAAPSPRERGTAAPVAHLSYC